MVWCVVKWCGVWSNGVVCGQRCGVWSNGVVCGYLCSAWSMVCSEVSATMWVVVGFSHNLMGFTARHKG